MGPQAKVELDPEVVATSGDRRDFDCTAVVAL